MQAPELVSIKMESIKMSQTREAGQDRNSKAVGSTGRCAVCFLLKHLGRLSAARMERGSSPLRNRATQTRGVRFTLAPLMEHEPCARAVF